VTIVDGLLFLAHRVPYPPTKGDKIRSFNLLKHLGQRHRLYLGAFVDDPADWAHESRLRELCHDVCLVNLKPGWRRLLSLRALLDGRPLSVAYFADSGMQRWVSNVLRTGAIRQALIFSSPMAQYVLQGSPPSGRGDIKTVMDFVDVDSDKWRMYGERRAWPMNRLYRMEARRLLAYDRGVAAAADASVFVSQPEADLFRHLVPEVKTPIMSVENGVDTEYFSPDREYETPYGEGDKVLVFTGAMDYWANEDAVSWFAREVFPHVRRRVPEAQFFIVGARPTDAVRRLREIAGVHVTGTVEDIRGYLHHAAVAVAPMRVARGIQNKVLEAMSMAKPVVTTPAAMHGIHATDELRSLVAEGEQAFAGRVIDLLTGGDTLGFGRLGREFVERRYRWSEKMSAFSSLLGDDKVSPAEGGSTVAMMAGEGG